MINLIHESNLRNSEESEGDGGRYVVIDSDYITYGMYRKHERALKYKRALEDERDVSMMSSNSSSIDPPKIYKIYKVTNSFYDALDMVVDAIYFAISLGFSAFIAVASCGLAFKIYNVLGSILPYNYDWVAVFIATTILLIFIYILYSKKRKYEVEEKEDLYERVIIMIPSFILSFLCYALIFGV